MARPRRAAARARRAALHPRVARRRGRVRHPGHLAPVRALLPERARAHRPRRHPGPRQGSRRPAPARHRRRSLRLQPRAGRRLLRLLRHRRGRGARARDRRRGGPERLPERRRVARGAAGAARADPGRIRPELLPPPLRPRHAGARRDGAAPAGLREGDAPAHRRHRPAPDLRLRPADRPVHVDDPRSAPGRDPARLHARLPLLPGGDDLAPHAAAVPGPRAAARRVRALALRLGGGRLPLALLRRLRLPQPAHRRLPGALGGRAGGALAPVAPDRDDERVARGADRPRQEDRLHAGARGGDRPPARGDQQGERRGGSPRARSSRSSRTAGRC